MASQYHDWCWRIESNWLLVSKKNQIIWKRSIQCVSTYCLRIIRLKHPYLTCSVSVWVLVKGLTVVGMYIELILGSFSWDDSLWILRKDGSEMDDLFAFMSVVCCEYWKEQRLMTILNSFWSCEKSTWLRTEYTLYEFRKSRRLVYVYTNFDLHIFQAFCKESKILMNSKAKSNLFREEKRISGKQQEAAFTMQWETSLKIWRPRDFFY